MSIQGFVSGADNYWEIRNGDRTGMDPRSGVQHGNLAAMILGHRGQLLLIPLLPALLFACWSLFRPALYSSTLMLSANRAELASVASDIRDAVDVELATIARLMRSGEFMDSLFGQAGEDGVGGNLTPGQLLQRLHVEPVPGTRLLRLEYTDSDPRVPASVLDHVASGFLSYREELATRRLRSETRAVLERIGQLSAGLWDEQVMVAESPDYWIPAAELAAQRPALQRVEEALMARVLADYDNALAGDVHLTVADQATAPRDTLSRNVLSASAALYGVTALLAVLVLWLRRQLGVSAAFPDRLASRLRVPLAGVLPAVPSQMMEEARRQGRIPDHDGYTEALRTLRTRLSVAARQAADELDSFPPARRGRIMLVSGPASGEGCTTTAMHLALMAGQVERVLLVDANLRQGDSDRLLFGLSRRDAGLSHLVAGAAPMHRCIHALGDEGFDVLPAGIVAPNPQELLSSSRFERILTVLGRRYDLIVIDAPPAGENSDVLLLARHASELLYVMRPGGAGAECAMAGVRQLREVSGAAPLSLLCTAVDTTRLARYGYPGWLTGSGGYRYQRPGGRFLAAG